ncbi:hypothetical protein [Amycolatopsis sp. H20-H5]|uniref:hypothetical protein n=1 Tax=Amycolatopsis sp. H20-H5 TaxID=3046309 RepID=UPI002DBAB2D2|nr:hypothetical protein [Amycolatopsis sp. H20-H5]MEC3980857.1 hypothetical protein [Amycolatopsis sp. H20-H5]
MATVIPGTPHPVPPQNNPGNPMLAYPEAEDQQIRDIADLIGAEGIINLLDTLRVFILGDIGKVVALADKFARDKKLIEAAAAINEVQLSLNGAWQGDGYAQFDKYAGLATSALSKGQDGIVKLTSTMTAVAKAVMDTYKTLIGFIGNCAANLIQVGGKVVIALLTAEVPVLNALETKDVIDFVNNAFATFWKDCSAALGSMITTVGDFVKAGVDFTSIENNFPVISPVGSSVDVIDDPQRWRIKPGADHS